MKMIMPERLQKHILKKKKFVPQRPIIKKINNPPPPKYDYYLSILCTFKNEAMNIGVWVEHYLWMGVDHFFLIDNGSDDNSREILQPYVDKGVVSVFYMPKKYQQTQHYRHVYKHHIKNNSKWVIMADSDEFWYVKDSTIKDTLPKYEKYNVIMSQWRNFGTDGHIEHPKDIRTAIVHRKEKLECTKCIFQSKNTNPQQVSIHRIDGETNIFKANNVFRINHYPIQSEEYFKNVKMVRRSAASVIKSTTKIRHDMKYFNHYNSDTNVLDTDLKDMIEKYETEKSTNQS